MLTGRPGVPRTRLGVWNLEMGFLGETYERAYNFNDTFSRGLYNTLIHKNNLFVRFEVTFNC